MTGRQALFRIGTPLRTGEELKYMKPQTKKVTGLALGWAISFGSLGAYGDDFFPQPDPVSNAPAARLSVAGATAKPISTDLTAPKMEGKAGDKVVEVEVIKERYPNRAIKIERHVTQDAERNYVNHGTWTMWDPNGTMLGKGEFWNGKRHGKWTRWHINPAVPGDLPEGEVAEDISLSGEEFENFERPFVSEATFVDGKLVGKWTITDAENRLIRSIEFDQDLLNGRAVWYHANGEIRRAAEYKKGVLDGELVEFTEDGDETLRANFVDGRRHAEAVKNYDTGEVLAEGWYLYAREQGDAAHDLLMGCVSFWDSVFVCVYLWVF
jgi:antitoxin component YwqK of YwqJK toxin-antitoxin module